MNTLRFVKGEDEEFPINNLRNGRFYTIDVTASTRKTNKVIRQKGYIKFRNKKLRDIVLGFLRITDISIKDFR